MTPERFLEIQNQLALVAMAVADIPLEEFRAGLEVLQCRSAQEEETVGRLVALAQAAEVLRSEAAYQKQRYAGRPLTEPLGLCYRCNKRMTGSNFKLDGPVKVHADCSIVRSSTSAGKTEPAPR